MSKGATATNPTKEVEMSATRTVTLRADLPMRGGQSLPAGTELEVSERELVSLAYSVKLAPQIGQTLSVTHPIHEGALLAVPTGYIAGYRELLQQALQLS